MRWGASWKFGWFAGLDQRKIQLLDKARCDIIRTLVLRNPARSASSAKVVSLEVLWTLQSSRETLKS